MSSSAITGPILSDVRRAPAGTAAAPSFAFNDSTGTGVYLVSPGVLGLSTAGVQRVVVTAAGDVGVGVTPVSILDAQKNSAATNPASDNTFPSWTSGLTLRNASATNFGYSALSFITTNAAGTNQGFSIVGQSTPTGFASNLIFMQRFDSSTTAERMRINASGNLILLNGLTIGSPSDPGGKILIAGAALPAGAGTHFLKWNNVSGSVTYDTSSARYKDNIRDSIYGLDSVLQMRSVQFEYKDTGRSDVGLIAEELNPIVPELVGKNEKGEPDSVSYDRVVSVLVKAVQELEARLAALESK